MIPRLLHPFAHALFLALLPALLAFPRAHAAPSSPPVPRPNVLLILADDLGFSDLGCYGGEIATPHLDSLARHGLRFTQFYNTSRCWPTRSALLTGYYPQAIRRDALPPLGGGAGGTRPAWARLLPAHLQSLGYRTYHSGKWHVDGPRIRQGFDHSYSIEDHDRNFGPRLHSEDDQPLPPVPADATNYFTSTAIVDHALRCLQEHQRRFPDRPFFHYLCFTSPHFPLQAPPADIAKYRDRYRVGWDAIRAERSRRQHELGLLDVRLPDLEPDRRPAWNLAESNLIARIGPGEIGRALPWAALNDVQRRFQADKMAVHAAMVDRMDQEIGRVLDQLRAMGVVDNTLILFLSDNGASAEQIIRGDGHDPTATPGSARSFLGLGPGWSSAANTPFRLHKSWTHEGGIATPLILHWPAGISRPGTLRHTVGHVVDLPVTLLELAGGEWPTRFDGAPVPAPHGRSLVPALARDRLLPHAPLWWLHENHRAILVDDWKLVSTFGDGQPGAWELYNLRRDRSETRNLAEHYPDRVRDLAAAWERRAAEFRALAQP